MTRYRLPEALGGGEMEEYRKVSGGTEAPTGTVAFLLDGCLICVAKSLLAEVAPPLPEEPPAGSAVAVGSYVYQRSDAERDNHWLVTGAVFGSSWAELCSGAEPPVRLVPDPLAGPMELPWEHVDREGYDIGVYESQRQWAAARVGQGEHCADLTAEACRTMARSLCGAADASERAS